VNRPARTDLFTNKKEIKDFHLLKKRLKKMKLDPNSHWPFYFYITVGHKTKDLDAIFECTTKLLP
jgi:hypothetical protein